MRHVVRMALFLIASVFGASLYASSEDVDQKTSVTRSSLEIGSNGVQFNFSQGDQDFFDIEKVLLGHMTKKLRSSSGKVFGGTLLSAVNMFNCYEFANLCRNSNNFLWFFFLAMSCGSFIKMVDSLSFALDGRNENILAIVKEYEDTGYVDPAILRKVALLFSRLKRDLQHLAINDSSSQLVKSVYSMANEISIDEIEDSREFEKVLNLFDYCGTILQKDGCCNQLKNDNGNELFRTTVLNFVVLMLFDLLKYKNII